MGDGHPRAPASRAEGDRLAVCPHCPADAGGPFFPDHFHSGSLAISLENAALWACAAKRGLPPIPAFGIGWLYPACPSTGAGAAIAGIADAPTFIASGEASPPN